MKDEKYRTALFVANGGKLNKIEISVGNEIKNYCFLSTPESITSSNVYQTNNYLFWITNLTFKDQKVTEVSSPLLIKLEGYSISRDSVALKNINTSNNVFSDSAIS